jgi:putative ABC transport system substrate-binding protein
MKRRQFITLIGAAAWPLTARGQVTRTRALIARLSSGSRDTPIIARFIERFLSGMRELGYVEGRDFDMTYGWADFHPDQLPRVAAELVNLAPDVILTGATIEAVAARKATATIPIVVPVLADPVELGFTTSDARPTGNVTGIMPYVKGLPSKQLELARELVPGATRISQGASTTAGDRGHRTELRNRDRSCGGAERRRYRRGVPSLGLGGRPGRGRGAKQHARQCKQADCPSRSVEEAALRVWLSPACRRGWPCQLRRQFGLVQSSCGVLR